MKYFLIILAFFFFTGTATTHATEELFENEETADTPCEPSLEIARSGCCSWHDGVCGCNGGRTVCCDGTYSPSCECLGDSEGTEKNLDKKTSSSKI